MSTRRSAAVLLVALALAVTGCTTAPPVDVAEVLETVAFPEPVAAEPGLALTLGEAVWVPRLTESGEDLTGIAVLAIVEGDADYWQGFDNPGAFTGSLPYFVIVQRVPPEGDPDPALRLWPLTADGADASLVLSEASGTRGPATCDGVELPVVDDPGHTVECFVATAAPGDVVAGVRYDGTDEFTFDPPTGNPYLDAPLVWTVG